MAEKIFYVSCPNLACGQSTLMSDSDFKDKDFVDIECGNCGAKFTVRRKLIAEYYICEETKINTRNTIGGY